MEPFISFVVQPLPRQPPDSHASPAIAAGHQLRLRRHQLRLRLTLCLHTILPVLLERVTGVPCGLPQVPPTGLVTRGLAMPLRPSNLTLPTCSPPANFCPAGPLLGVQLPPGLAQLMPAPTPREQLDVASMYSASMYVQRCRAGSSLWLCRAVLQRWLAALVWPR